jgi:anaerobic magnesium-protoporphyrin IX monomethyl ester cyclase
MTTYGYPYNCDFCSRPVFGDTFRKRDVSSVMEEIRDIQRLGYDSLWIADDCFALDVSYLEETCFALIDEYVDIGWSCLSRVYKINPEITSCMRSAGCVKVYLGLESGCDAALALMGKRTTVRKGADAVRIFNDAGIKTTGFFIVGYPGEDMGSIKRTFELALSLPMDEISFTVPYPLPGSPLFERTGSRGLNADWEIENEVKFLYDSEVDADTIKQMIDDTMRELE